MSLRSLIKGETISIDNHNHGVAIDIDDSSIHLHKRFNSDNNTNERTLTQAGENSIKEIINRVYDYFRGPTDELKSLQYIHSKVVIAQFSQNQNTPSRHISILSDRFIDANIPLSRPKSYYVKADLRNKSFSLSSSRKELTGNSEE